MNRLSFIINLKQEAIDASILREVSYQERNERLEEHNHEERQAGNAGCLSGVRNEDVQNRKDITLIIISLSRVEIGGHLRNTTIGR